MSYSAYVLSQESREALLNTFKPTFAEAIAHHVTYAFPDDSPPPPIDEALIIGHSVNHRIECVVVRIDGVCDRPRGGIYHITLSLDRAQGAKPKHSNQLLKRQNWSPVEPPISIELTPKLITF